MKFTQKYFSLGKVALLSAAGVTFLFLFWEIGEKIIGYEHEQVGGFKYIVRGVLTAFITTFLLSVWVIRKVALEREKHEHEMDSVNKKLRELAITDGVTGAYNHRYFEITLEREWQKTQRLCHPLACIMIDLDNFKQINDKYGHQAGDMVLRGIASLLRREFREIDIISRYGGEEFAVILLEKPSHTQGLLKTMERIRKQIEMEKFQWKEQTIRITASLGGALAPNPKFKLPEMLVQAADQAMYCAKKQGKNASYLIDDCANCVRA